MIKNIHIMKKENSPTAATIVADSNWIGTRTIVEELILSSNVKAVVLQKIKPQLYLKKCKEILKKRGKHKQFVAPPQAGKQTSHVESSTAFVK